MLHSTAKTGGSLPSPAARRHLFPTLDEALMTLSTRALLPLLLTTTLALHGCGDKDGGDDTSGGGSGDDGGGDDGGSDLPPEGTNAGECTDGADNDADGLFDCNDPDCAGSPDCSEANTPGGCSDGADNDGDGLFDCDDPDCAGDEACGDGIEGNDAGECEDGIDNDGDGLTDCEDDDCAGFDGCDDYEGDEPGECADGEDNDSDGLTDCDDDGCEGSPDCEDLDEGLVAYFPFDGDSSDHGPSSFPTVDSAVSYTTDRDGRDGQAGRFDGSNSYVQATTDFMFSTESELTWMAWVNWDSTGVTQYPTVVRLHHGECGGAEAAITSVRNEPSTLDVLGRMFNECSGGSGSSGTLQPSIWHHVAVVHNGSDTSLYIDGIEVSNDPFDATVSLTSTGTVDIGFGVAADTYFDGSIDEVRIYSRALTSSTIAALATR